jgi:hypothetical protein
MQFLESRITGTPWKSSNRGIEGKYCIIELCSDRQAANVDD